MGGGGGSLGEVVSDSGEAGGDSMVGELTSSSGEDMLVCLWWEECVCLGSVLGRRHCRLVLFSFSHEKGRRCSQRIQGQKLTSGLSVSIDRYRVVVAVAVHVSRRIRTPFREALGKRDEPIRSSFPTTRYLIMMRGRR